jgi:hypothetical protein
MGAGPFEYGRWGLGLERNGGSLLQEPQGVMQLPTGTRGVKRY